MDGDDIVGGKGRGAQKIVSGEGRCYRGTVVSLFLFLSQSSAFILHRNHHTAKSNPSSPSAIIFTHTKKKNLSDSLKPLFSLLDIIKKFRRKSYHELLKYTMLNAVDELTGLCLETLIRQERLSMG